MIYVLLLGVVLFLCVWIFIEARARRFGNDGLNRKERAEYARRWREGSGSPGTKEEFDNLKKILAGKK